MFEFNTRTMNKTSTYITFLYLLISICSFGQTSEYVVNRQNCRDGENVEYCQTHLKMQELLKDPVRQQEYLKYQAEQAQLIYSMEHSKSSSSNEKGTVYRIPIVFHVLHNGGAENISYDQILDQLAVLNRDYRKLNLDVNDVVPEFKSLTADIEIEFVLANRDPLGRPFGGVTRTMDPITNTGGTANESTQLTAIKTKNDIYQGEWSGKQYYLNVFVCANVGSTAAGYTRNPSGDKSMANGIWILHNYVGSIGTSSVNTSRALTHEIGHWLNLSHTWGGTNSPGQACGDDGVSDTPITMGYTSCLLTASKVCNANIVENVENFMDYSYCSKMFTLGQKTAMRAALLSTTGGRNNIWTANNLNSVAPLSTATILANKTTICPGESVTFYDNSYSQATTWSWEFTGGTPSTSTAKIPSVSYSTPGYYAVKLTSTLNGSSVTDTKTQYIQVVPASTILPIYETFIGYQTLFDIPNWNRYDQGNNRPFEVFQGAGFSDDKCVKLSNYDETATTTIDELGSRNIDLSAIPTSQLVTLTFKYAYRKKATTNSESLKVLLSNDCGLTWQIRKTISSSYLPTEVVSSSWTPTSPSDWTTVHVTTISSQFYKTNFRYKFQFTSDGGNNLYLDDINLYKGSPSNDIVLGLNDNSLNVDEFEIYPNPSEGELNVHFSIPSDNQVYISIKDVMGKLIQTNSINGVEGSNLVLLDTKNLSPGIYFLNTQIGNSVKVSQFVVR